MTYREKKLDSTYSFRGHIVNVRVDHVEAVGGRTAVREVAEHADGVVMAALLDDGRILLERQFRYAVGKEVLEVPAGKMDPGEEPVGSALRELREETGYRAGKIRELTSAYSSVGFCTEKLHIFLCTDLTQGERDLDETEDIEIIPYPLEEAWNMAMTGEIEDAKTQIAVLMTMELVRSGKLDEYMEKSE
ncbi:NUDIX hydrolase [Eubacterium pyruvativorans]|uniref:NUDIX hydrolase n=1 Tax=Eubacterium pyruvativorans TaxID=155865 RepID=UPI00088B2DBF|nr:NUDIX hydrolase [Eubacterium pyruvativorans]SDE84178.1 ADP-ribose pyrophosphatase [Eubacterium pyruvativorans]